jgi:xanthine dehydrogenase molybdenum-binding subunit
MEISFSLNGRPVSTDVRDGERLLEVLRDRLGLRSMKDGCAPEGSCGACTVLVNGRAAVSCAQDAVRVQGHDVVTLEGLPDATRDLWADAFVSAGAAQCGYCTPGIVMKAESTLARDPAPTREALARSLAGNLCRCTGYVKILDALETVAAVRRGELPAPTSGGQAGVGARADRYDGRDLVLGDFPFVRDMVVPGMLHGAVVLSAHPRAIVKRIDMSRAEQVPGIVRVATWRDVPGVRHQGLIFQDWPLLVAEGETTRYVGDVLAVVAAETRHAAREAADLVEVEYEVLEPVLDAAAALAAGAPRVHDGGNLLATAVIKIGDVDGALANAAHVVRETFRTQAVEHAFLEPEACLVVPEATHDRTGQPRHRLRVFSQGQGVWEDRHQIASLLGLSEAEVRVTQVATGGGFGGKEDLSVQGHAALLAFLTGKPVHLALSRAESLRLHPKRHALVMDYTAGCDLEGRLVAVRARIVGDTGAYASVGDKVLERAAGHACASYRVPNVDVESRTVYTNNPPAGAFRGFGAVQVDFAMEGILDRLAEQVGIDGWEIRWRNALDVGDRTGTGQKLGPGVGLKKTLLAVRDGYRSARFAGIACGMKNVGVGNGMREGGRAILRPEADGTVTLYHSWTEMGQGIHTVLRQIVVDELGIGPDKVHVVVDTERELNTGETTASRATTLGGQAVIDAARRLRAEAGDRPLSEFEGREFPGEYVVDWTTTNDAPEPITHFAYGWSTQVVVLDDDGRLSRVIAAQDVGKVMNPTTMEGQVEGGVHMGLGMALSEDLGLHDGMPVLTLKQLGIIPPSGMPPVECILVEEPQPEGPYGAKGAGEAVLVPTPGAVAGALFAFDGIRRTTLPMRDTPAARAAAPNVARLLARAQR